LSSAKEKRGEERKEEKKKKRGKRISTYQGL
jgi:hypothetical protein